MYLVDLLERNERLFYKLLRDTKLDIWLFIVIHRSCWNVLSFWISQTYHYYRRPNRDRYVWSETHRRPTCLIRVSHEWLEIYQRQSCLNGEGNAWSEINISDQRPIRDLLKTEMHYQILICPVGDPWETDLLNWRPIRNSYLTTDLRLQNDCILHQLSIFR